MKLTPKDRAILKRLQADATLSLQEMADDLGMSQSTVWRKVQEFEKHGVITGRVALVDPAAVDLKICVITNITLTSHGEEATTAFQALVSEHPEIMDCYSISGGYDYMLKVRVSDVEAYEAFLTQYLLRNPYVASVSSGFTLRQLKHTTALPL